MVDLPGSHSKDFHINLYNTGTTDTELNKKDSDMAVVKSRMEDKYFRQMFKEGSNKFKTIPSV
jgi:hypothetical protein